MKNVPSGTFGGVHSLLREHIKLAKLASSQEQDTGSEHKAPSASSDAEVKDALPAGGNPSGRGVTDLTNTGVGAGQSLPGVNLNPPTEEKERKETSPETKLAAIDPGLISLRDRLAGNLKLAAEMLIPAAPSAAKKTAATISSLGEAQKPTDPVLSASTTADTSTTTPVVTGVTGVSQADPSPGAPSPGKQGPEEKSAELSPETLDAIAQKTAQFTGDYNVGRTIAAALMSKLAAPSPEELDRDKLAAAVENATMISTANAMLSAGVEKGVITHKQADDLASLLGLNVNPLNAAVEAVQQKLAELVQSPIGTNEQKLAFLEKIADEDPGAAAAAAGGQPPVDPEQLKAAIGQLLGELQQAVQSGQMSEEQAVGILQQLGLPVGGEGGDPGAGGAPPDAGGGAPPADPSDTGAPSGMPGGAAPAEDAGGGSPIPPDAGAAAGAAEAAGGPPEKKEESGEKKPDADDSKEESEKKEAALHNRRVFGSKLAVFMVKKALDPNAPPINIPSQLQTPPASGTALLPNYLGTAQGTSGAKPPLDIPVGGAAPAAAGGNPLNAIAVANDPVGSARAAAGAQSHGMMAPAAAGAGPSVGGITLTHILSGLGLAGLGGMAYKGLTGDDEEKKKHKHAEAVDPAMAAASPPGGDPGAAPGGDPAGAGEPSVEQLLSELQQLVASGQVSQEEAQQIVAAIQQGGGGDPGAAAGGAPPPGAGAPVA